MLTMADKGGGGVWTPSFLADIICEQPLMRKLIFSLQMFALTIYVMLHFNNVLKEKKTLSI